MNSEVQLSVLMPCLNEAKTLGACIEKIHSSCQALNINYEVLISDNGSTDGSIEIAHSMNARVVHAKEKGYGAALKFGFEQSRGRYTIFADADDTYDFLEIGKFWQLVQQGHPVVIGTRLKGFIHPGAMPFLHRYLGTPVLTFLIRWLYSIPISDCNCGMRLLSKQAYSQLKMKSSGMEFASEMLVKLGLTKIPVVEIPIQLWPDRRGRPPHLKTWRDGWRHLRFILMYAPNKIFIGPGFFLFLLGLLGVFSFFGGPIQTGNRLIDYHTQIAFATLGIMGFTMWSFGQLIYFFSHVNEFMNQKSKSGYLKLNFEGRLLMSASLMLLGLGIAAWVVYQWALTDFTQLAQVHKFVVSVFLLVTGFMGSLLAATLFAFEYDK